MDYKEKYEAALERARRLYDLYKGNPAHAQPFVDIFPELAESEDERIRKALIEGVRQIRCKNGITQEQMIAYLEKQKESSPDDIAAAYQLGRADERKAKEQKPIDIRTWQKIVDKVLTDYNGIGQYLDNGICKQIAEELREKYCFDDTSSDWENVYKKGIERGENYGKAQAMKEQKSEWSDEDEKVINDASCWIAEYAGSLIHDNYAKASSLYGLAERLKSLRPHPHWKPSEEQINSFRAAKGVYEMKFMSPTSDNRTIKVLDSLDKALTKLKDG